MQIRSAKASDVEDLLELERKCWDQHLRASSDLILQRILSYQEGQYVYEVDGKVCGVLYTQRVDSVKDLQSGRFETQGKLHRDKGKVVQLMSIGVDTSVASTAATALRNHALSQAVKGEEIDCVVAMTRCSQFFKWFTPTEDSVSVDDIETRKAYSKYVYGLKDPTIYFHISGGAKILELVPDYRKEDIDNLGHAILIQYDIKPEKKEGVKAKIESMSNEICGEVLSWCSPNTNGIPKESIVDRPLMNVLNSLEMLKLHNWLESRTKTALKIDFLFNYTSIKAVAEFLVNGEKLTSPAVVSVDAKPDGREPVAIVGLACRLPSGINSLADLETVLTDKRCLSRRVPDGRWDQMDYSSADISQERLECVNQGCFLDGIDSFDPNFFGMTHTEVKEMDPNQRLMLEMCTRALYDCGKTKDQLAGSRTGVYVGVSNSDYQDIDGVGFKDSHSVYGATGGALSVIAGRVSFLLGLCGPSMVIDTACSSSLVAIHQAVRALQSGDCDDAVVASVNLMLTPWVSVAYARAGMTSPDGKCHTFDQSANGYCRGEGCGAIVLKRLSDAEACGDKIYAVIKGSAVMHDGKSASLTAPNGKAQEQLLRAALKDAALQPTDISVLEAHGTGTKLGDPIECGAIVNVFGGVREDGHPIQVSSVKANVGHLEATAGLAGLFALIVSLNAKKSFGNASLVKLNPKIADICMGQHIVFPCDSTSIDSKKSSIIGGVSSFGYSGTIAHVLVESGKVSTVSDRERLALLLPQTISDNRRPDSVLWQFAGQGTLSINSGKDMYEQEEVFSKQMNICDKIMVELTGLRASDVLYPSGDTESMTKAQALLDDTRFSQSLLVCFQFCLAKWLQSRGFHPHYLLGHSLGEFCAMVIAEVLSLEDCLRLVCARSALVFDNEKCRGSMTAIRSSADDVKAAIADCGQESLVSIAAINGPRSTVVSGSTEGVAAVVARLSGVPTCALKMRHAFHSPLMKNIVPEYKRVLDSILFSEPKIRIISTVLGRPISLADLTPLYWINHLTETVRYFEAVVCAQKLEMGYFLEIGADSTLTKMAGSILGSQKTISLLSSADLYSKIGTTKNQNKKNLFDDLYKPQPISYKGNDASCSLAVVPTSRVVNLFDRYAPILKDHMVHGRIVVPGAALLEVLLKQCLDTSIQFPICITDFLVQSPVIVNQSVLEKYRFLGHENLGHLICSLSGSTVEMRMMNHGLVNAQAELTAGSAQEWASIVSEVQRKQSSGTVGLVCPGHDLYALYSQAGLEFGPTYRTIRNVHWLNAEKSECLCSVHFERQKLSEELLGPDVLDTMIHATGCITLSTTNRLYVPFSISRTVVMTRPQNLRNCKILITLVNSMDNSAVFDCALISSSGEVVVVMTGLQMRQLQKSDLAKAEARVFNESAVLLHHEWIAAPFPACAAPSTSSNVLVLSVPMCRMAAGLRNLMQVTSVVWKDSLMGSLASLDRSSHVVVCNPLAVLEFLRKAQFITSELRGWLQIVELLSKIKRWTILSEEASSEASSGLSVSSIVSTLLTAKLEYNWESVKSVTVDSILNDFDKILNDVCSQSPEDTNVRFCEGNRFVRRFVEPLLYSQEIYMPQRGSIDDLHLVPMKQDLTDLKDDEVQVAVKAVSLNFRDVLNILGAYPGDPGDPGCECSGVVTKVGSGVKNCVVGDRVACMKSGVLKESVRVASLLVHKSPATLTYEQAATLPIVYATVEHALTDLAVLKKGETVLIHAAAGGVGLAAIQYAKSIGAKVIATASDNKRAYLQNIGVACICDSRNAVRFKEELLQFLGPQGIDVVLNSLSDDFIPYSLDALTSSGRFIEIGKRSIWTRDEVTAKYPGIVYHTVAIDSLSVYNPELYQNILSRVCRRFENGEILPQVTTTYDFHLGYKDALRHLQSGSNIGKIVLSVREKMDSGGIASTGLDSVIITGGLGGLGLLTARVLADRGAKHIFLASRSGAVSHTGQGLEDDLHRLMTEYSTTQVHVVRCDVSDEQQVVQMLADVRRVAGGIGGVFHCAGVLRDALIQGGGAVAGCSDVWSAKAQSAWWLHKHTQTDVLTSFVCYSSIVSVMGNAGQSAYGAANRFLDELMSERRRQGVCGVSIRWPAIRVVGMAEAGSRNGVMSSEGWSVGIEDVEHVLRSYSEFPSSVLVCPNDLVTQFTITTGAKTTAAVMSLLNSELKKDDVGRIVRKVVRTLIGSVVEDDSNLLSLLDSLGSVELSNLLSKQFGIKISPTLVFNFPTSIEVIAFLEEELGLGSGNTLESEAVTAAVAPDSMDIAIIGVGCSLPGDVDDLNKLWDLKLQSRCATGEVPLDRWDSDAVIAENALPNNETMMDRIRYGGCLSLSALNSFDAARFKIAAQEANKMDTAQKLVLSISHEALEDAGYLHETNTGVFVGVVGDSSSSAQVNLESTSSDYRNFSVYDATKSATSVVAGRISHALELNGPTLAVDTACSSSLVALHYARRSLQHNECTQAIVAAVNILRVNESWNYTMAGMTSPDGKCHTFDQSANGYCRGEGCGAIVLKRLSDAEACGDKIYAVIKGSAVMHDGKSASLTAPNGKAQEQLLRAALADARVSADAVQYIEAHGTGTKLGDPIEVESIAAVYGGSRCEGNQLYLNSVKANIGHLEAAAGMAAILSAILTVNHSIVPGNANLQKINDAIGASIAEYSIAIPCSGQAIDLPSKSPVIAAVSSFGYSGTIAHMILQAPPRPVEFPKRIAAGKARITGPRSPHQLISRLDFEKSSGLMIATTRFHNRVLSNWLRDHEVSGRILVPGVALLELMCSIGTKSRKSSMETSIKCMGLVVSKPLEIDSNNEIITSERDITGKTEVHLGKANEKVIVASGSVLDATSATLDGKQLLEKARRACIKSINVTQMYLDLRSMGLNYGPAFQLVKTCSVSHYESLSVIELRAQNRVGYTIHPTVLDAMLHSAFLLFDHGEQLHVPFAFDDVTIHLSSLDKLWSHSECQCVTRRRLDASKSAVFDCWLWSMDGIVVVEMKGIYLLLLNEQIEDSQEKEEAFSLYSSDLEEIELPAHMEDKDMSSWTLYCDNCSEWARGGDFQQMKDLCGFDAESVASNVILVLRDQTHLKDLLKLMEQVNRNPHVRRVLVVLITDAISGLPVLEKKAWMSAIASSQCESPSVALSCMFSDQTELTKVYIDIVNNISSPPNSALYSMNHKPFRSTYKHLEINDDLNYVLRSPHSFVITGGLGGLGLLTARVLADRGAKHIFLASRSGAVSHTGQGLEDDLHRLMTEYSATQVHVVRCDVSDEQQVVQMLTDVRRVAGGIDGVFHCAGVLRDALIQGGGAAAECSDVWSAKAQSAWWLHKHTQTDVLTSFVCYSSIVSVMGNAGQSAYGAANRFLDELMSERRRQGVCGVSIRWPAIRGVGMFESISTKAKESLLRILLSPDAISEVVDLVLGSDLAASHSVLTVCPASVDLNKLLVVKNVSTKVLPSEAPNGVNALNILSTVRSIVKSITTDISEIDDSSMLMESGLDSLGAAQLAADLSSHFQVSLLPTLVFSYPTISDIANHLVSMSEKNTSYGSEQTLTTNVIDLQDVAIVGVDVKLPHRIRSLDDIWEMLKTKRDLTEEVDRVRWDTEFICSQSSSATISAALNRMKYGSFFETEEVEEFDAAKFGIAAKEALRMDPCQQLLLESSYNSLLDAGYTTAELNGLRAGVFVAAMGNLEDNQWSNASIATLMSEAFTSSNVPPVSAYEVTGNTLSVAAGRISYALGLTGPSTTTDTACSSALVALHNARRSLQLGECEVAVVSGANILGPSIGVALAVSGMTSPDGKCHTFDQSANGYCRGEGCGAIVLKRLSDAEACGDKIYAVIKGSAVMHDGKSASLTAPNGKAQEQLLRAALADARVSADAVQYIEAHGTGTKLGDPIEIESITNVYCEKRAEDNPLFVSAIKANIGHLEAGAGMASILSAIAALRHREAPPNAQLKTLNPVIAQSIKGKLLSIPTELTPLTVDKSKVLHAGVSSFGYSGTIAHVILAGAEEKKI